MGCYCRTCILGYTYDLESNIQESILISSKQYGYVAQLYMMAMWQFMGDLNTFRQTGLIENLGLFFHSHSNPM